jgi:hypothetical protein
MAVPMAMAMAVVRSAWWHASRQRTQSFTVRAQRFTQRGPLAATKTGTTYGAGIDLPPIQVVEPMNLSRFRQGVGAKEARIIQPPMNADERR